MKNKPTNPKPRKRWRLRVCSRCGKKKLTRLWEGIAILCGDCIDIAQREMLE
mgnify:CR=1 FL=1